jgi:putative addiction module component (TIGR02574 family)
LNEELLNRVLELPVQDRAILAHKLLLSLEPDDFDEDSEDAWRQELEQRLARVEQGQYSARPWRDAIAEIRQSLAQEKGS